MMDDILGKILDAKKGQAMTVTINIEPDQETEEQSMSKQGMAPLLRDEAEDESEEIDSKSLMNGEEDDMIRKKKMGEKPMNLAQRAKMAMLEK